jgi:hypothetical protein
MYYRRFDDRIVFIPSVDEEGRQITLEEMTHLESPSRILKAHDREGIRKECWEELRKYRAIHGTPPIE